MKVALTIWEDRISPLFDAAREMLVAEIKDNLVVSRRQEPISPQGPYRIAERLAEQGVTLLICGAISEQPAGMIESAGIKLVPFVAGSVNDVLGFLAKGAPITPMFSMPGCGGGPCRRAGGPGKGKHRSVDGKPWAWCGKKGSRRK